MNKKKAKEIVKKKFRKKLLEDNLNNIRRKSESFKRNAQNVRISLKNIKLPTNLTDQFTLRDIEIPSIDLYKKKKEKKSEKKINQKNSHSKTSLFNQSYSRKKNLGIHLKKKSLIMKNIKNQNKNASLRNINIPTPKNFQLHKRNSLSNCRNHSLKSKNSQIFLNEEYTNFGSIPVLEKNFDKKNNFKNNLDNNSNISNRSERKNFSNRLEKNCINNKVEKNLQNVNVNVNLNFRINQKLSNIKNNINQFTFKNKLSKDNIVEKKKIKKSVKKLKFEKKEKKNKKLELFVSRKSRLYNKSNIIYNNKNTLKKKEKVRDKIYKNYYLKPLLEDIKLFLGKEKNKNNFKLENSIVLKHFFENYKKFQYMNKLKLKNKNFIFPININLEYFSHKIKSKKYLVLDMDETLIYSSRHRINETSIKILQKKNVF